MIFSRFFLYAAVMPSLLLSDTTVTSMIAAFSLRTTTGSGLRPSCLEVPHRKDASHMVLGFSGQDSLKELT